MPYIGTSPSNGVRRVHTYTATASQTTFTGASSEGVTLSYADTNYIDVFQNGVLLGSADYTSTSGTSVVLAQGASVGDLIVITVYDVFGVADTISKKDGGTFDGNVTMGGTLGVTGATTLTGALSAKGGVVFNEDSADVDFRVESDDNTHAFFVEGSSGDVGIGPSTINKTLHISKSTTSTDGTVYPGLQIENTSAGSGNSYANIVLHGGNATTQFSILADGRSSNSDVYIRTDTSTPMRFLINGSESVRLDTSRQIVHTCDAGGIFALHTFNDGNNANRYGILVQSGNDDASGTNYSMQFRDGDGTTQGQITFSGGTVSYGTFTAYHPCVIPDSDNDKDSLDNAYPYGTLLEIKSVSYTQKNKKDTERGIVYNVQKSSSAKSKAILGAYGSSMNGSPINDEENETNKHQALVLGDGHILCNNENGDIEIGDYICTSSTNGEGMKATSICTTIGVAREAVTFSNSTAKLVAVEYGYKQFIPENLEARITALEKG